MKLYKKDASNRKISPQLITCALEKNASMHDIKSATLTILLNGLLSAVKVG